MTRNEFDEGFARLVTIFGLPWFVRPDHDSRNTHLPAARDWAGEYFTHFAANSQTEWGKICHQALASCSKFPKLVELLDIRESIFPQRDRNQDDEAEIRREQEVFGQKLRRARDWLASLSPEERDEIEQIIEAKTKKRWPGFLEYDLDRPLTKIARSNALIETYEKRYPFREKRMERKDREP